MEIKEKLTFCVKFFAINSDELCIIRKFWEFVTKKTMSAGPTSKFVMADKFWFVSVKSKSVSDGGR